MINTVQQFIAQYIPLDIALVITLFLFAMILIIPLMLSVAYLTYAERKIIGYMQARIGPNRVGPKGWLQPIADFLKLLFKEVIYPNKANLYLYFVAPIMAIAPAITVWAVVPLSSNIFMTNLDVSLLFVLAVGSLGVYGIILAGWASNSKYALLGALRSAALLVSYEIAIGFALVTVVMLAGSVNLQTIVEMQKGGILDWYWLPLLPMLVVFFISALVETNRAPFDVVEGESEIVGGTHVEYSGMSFAIFFLAEYANMILMSVLTTLLFFGGWYSPFNGVPYLGTMFSFIPGFIWVLFKTIFFLFLFLWFRATFPRFRYDQIMRLCWKIFLPLTIVWIFVIALTGQLLR
ncbi:NADH-ubiquinone oxidoreductase chain H [hydrothermal vent metagenome]|uniref:NADH-ubiquinone oxidoreductase chain H n=1 Tax=hydrothermal vent metagenome TaxID=652676 RepID=A0A1W1CBU8_9ZZZZ